ncbi:SDR family NAD(P)-dependent oxidoreductase [Pseudenhygromyxa sp. WMMC2535]|uniref:SDR family NAD(P)-dependent oxidoreductase n=1 Tax=Pseudenhygromyxa sp. WMMC2535 TaxID=2712867 RepID=UPI0015563D84|nr:SDR family NAD(P)-dependent oxidoreductase [Pseudenhygromyxa sp. WMMC2535]NVB38697.1 SDR family NAD(P)-dependent oxidoreductase [Pseudenhygromyxa sp. WMMC2535]
MKLEGKLAVITGASQGIGAATSRRFARLGARVILMARTEAKLRALADEIREAGGEAHVRACDLSDPELATATMESLVAEFGVPDILVNNAGAGRWLAIDETEPAEAVAMIGAPYLAAFFASRVVVPGMIARRGGVIVNVQSPMSRLVSPGATGYAAARWALRGFTAGLRSDLIGTGVSVVEVILGEVESNYWANNPGAKERIPGLAHQLMPPLSPERAAKAIVRGVECERAVIYDPPMLWLLSGMIRAAPRLVQALINRTGWQRPQ